MRFSVTPSSFVPSSLNSTRLTAVGNSHVFRHFPDLTSHRRMVLSADPLAIMVDVGSTSTVQMAPTWPWYVPRRSPLWANQAHICWSLAVEKMMSPSILYLFWGRGEVSVWIHFHGFYCLN